MPLTKMALQQIQTKKRLRQLLVLALDRTEATIIYWAAGNSIHLLRPETLRIIREETGLSEAEILVAN